jgi:hypothetical protein
VPIAPIALDFAKLGRYLVGGGLDFLKADDVRALTRDPLEELRMPCPDAVDVPRGDL